MCVNLRGPADSDDDGSALLTSSAVGELLEVAVEHAGGTLLSWTLDHVDFHPSHSTTATYSALVEWSYGRREELLGVSARVGGLTDADERAEIFADGDREVAVWIYPQDPDLPGLARAAYATEMAEVLNTYGLVPGGASADKLDLRMIGYRPRRRAVVRLAVRAGGPVFYVKVLRERSFRDVRLRHELLTRHGVPAPEVVATTDDFLLITRELPGSPLARSIFDPETPCSAEDLVRLLDSMPATVSGLSRRAPWADSVGHYATMVARAMPVLEPKLDWIVARVTEGLAPIPHGNEPTHGDFHEGQVHVLGGRVCGILDVDTVGPGRRADDLACMVAHLSTIQHMDAEQTALVHGLIRDWVPVFDERVDPVELRLRAAAVIVSLATGPFRGQEPDWEAATARIVRSAEALVRQVS